MKPFRCLTWTAAIALAASAVAQSSAVPAFRLTDAAGKVHTAQTLRAKPTLVVFLSEGCPHNPKAAPDLNRLARQLAPQVNVVAMTNLDATKARAYARELKLTVPLIADPSGKTIEAFGASHSLDLALIGTGNRGIVQRWDGYSQPILTEVLRALAANGGPRLSPDLSTYPKTRQSGCGF